jgi:ribosomal protein S18 acetylase RimI-like enzyme
MKNDSVELPGQQTLLACWNALARLSPGSRLVQLKGSVAAVFPSWLPLNNAILLGGHDTVSAAAEASSVARLYKEAAVPAWALWRPTQTSDLDTADVANELGALKRDTTTLVMRASLSSRFRRRDAVLPASIAAVAGFDDDVQLGAGDLGVYEAVPGLSGWALLDEGVVVTAAWSFLHGSDCGVYAVETAARSRRRGFARSLMEHVLADAQERGATTATLQSTRMGQALYESLGFTAAGRYEEWICQ